MYVAADYWADGYIDEGVVATVPRGDDAAFRSAGERERFWAKRAEDWLEDRLERIEEVARAPKKTRKNFAANFLEKAESLNIPQPRVDALAVMLAELTAPQPDYTALAMQVAEWMDRIARDRRRQRERRDIEALMALGEI